jgi:type IV pilus assembly protein PilP
VRRSEVARALRSIVVVSALLGPAAFVAGCEDEWVPPPDPPGAAPGQAAPGAGATGSVDGGAGRGAKEAELAPLPERQFTEADFSETERNRDPFRGFAAMFSQQAKGQQKQQRQVIVDRFSLDELKLVGVVTRTAPRVLFTDPAGLGWVLKTGDYVGKPEIVHTGGPAGIDVAINWRVDRIRESDVVFVREDPAHPEIAPVTRVVSLFPREETPGGPGTR